MGRDCYYIMRNLDDFSNRGCMCLSKGCSVVGIG